MIILSISEAYNTWCPLVANKTNIDKIVIQCFFQHWFSRHRKKKKEMKNRMNFHHRLCRKFYGNYSSEMMEVVLFKGLLFLSTHTFSIVCVVESVHICICYSHCLIHANKRLVKMLKERNRIQKFILYCMKLLSVPPFNAHSNKMPGNETYSKVDVIVVIHS